MAGRLFAGGMHADHLATVGAEIAQQGVAGAPLRCADDRSTLDIEQRSKIGPQGVGHCVSKSVSSW